MKKVLLAVSGLSPQILTESLYALAVSRSSAFIPDDIYLITTLEGADRARLLLLSEKPGWFHRLLRDYKLPQIRFDEQHIQVLETADGQPLRDIKTPEDNAVAADGITNFVRELTLDADSMIHASIAGGRKTLGFYLGYAMSLFGRPQDELSHVLVSSPFESLLSFFFPTRNKEIIYAREGSKPLDASQAQVWLANIPFVRMRQGIPEVLQKGNARFSEVVAAASKVFLAPSVIVETAARRITTSVGTVHLPPVELAFYRWLAKQRQTGTGAIFCPADGCPDVDSGKAFVDNYLLITNNGLQGHDRTREALRDGMTKAYFEQRKSLINKAIRHGLGVNASPYEITRSGSPGRYRFGLFQLQATQIAFA